MSENYDEEDDRSTESDNHDAIFADDELTRTYDNTPFDNVDFDRVTADDPEAFVSRTEDLWHVIGADMGQTVYAADLTDPHAADTIAKAINAVRMKKMDEANETTDDDEQFETNAERVAQDDDVMFAITREENLLGPKDLAKNAVFGLVFGVVVGVGIEKFEEWRADDDN